MRLGSSAPRKIVLLLGLALLVFGGIGAYRAANPPLSPDQQIVRELQGLESAIESRSASGVSGYLAPRFSWNGLTKDDLNRQMRGAFAPIGAGVREVQLDLSGVHVEIQGPGQATSSGDFRATYRIGEGSPETRNGRFNCVWELQDGQWKIIKLSGGEDVA